jgi:hypothetical protein
MLELLWLVPAIPFAALWCLRYSGARMSHKSVTQWAVGSVAASASHFLLIAAAFLSAPPAANEGTRKPSGRGSTSAPSARRSPSIWTRSHW